MEVELIITFVLLLGLTFLATVDMAFGQLSDVGLRRLSTEAEEHPGAVATFLENILEDRPRFRFTIGAAVQIVLVAVSVLITVLSFRWFAAERAVLFSLVVGLLVAGFFRQFVPRLLSLRNPEKTLLILLPWVRPFYGLLSLLADPLHSKARRWKKETTAHDNSSADDDDDNEGDIQALIDV